MQGGTDKERDGERGPSRQVVPARSLVDVAQQEVVDGQVPPAGELEPVARVPPVGVELAVGKAGDLRERVEDELPEDEPGEEEEGREGEHDVDGGCVEEDAEVVPALAGADGFDACRSELIAGLSEGRDDEFFGQVRHYEDASKHGERIEKYSGPPYLPRRPWILELVAQRRAQQVIHVVGQRQVLRISHMAQRRGEFHHQLFAQLFMGCSRFRHFFLVQFQKAALRLAEMAIVERVRVDLHQYDHCV